MLATLNMLGAQKQPESNVMPAMVTWRKWLTVHACDLMPPIVNRVMDYVVDSRALNVVARLEGVAFFGFCHRELRACNYILVQK